MALDDLLREKIGLAFRVVQQVNPAVNMGIIEQQFFEALNPLVDDESHPAVLEPYRVVLQGVKDSEIRQIRVYDRHGGLAAIRCFRQLRMGAHPILVWMLREENRNRPHPWRTLAEKSGMYASPGNVNGHLKPLKLPCLISLGEKSELQWMISVSEVIWE
ncbi:MAG TPA: hypothetical protein VGE59_04405 [Patescibacteria group bacterium]